MSLLDSRIFDILDAKGVGAIWVTDLVNICYLTGFTGSSAALLVTKGRSYLLTDGRYELQAEREVRGAEVLICKKRLETLASLLEKDGIDEIAFESKHLSHHEWKEASAILKGRNMLPLQDEVRRLRLLKGAEALAAIRRGSDIAFDAFCAVRDMIIPGTRESDIALSLEVEMRKRGASKASFDIIVASGKQSALPHARPGEKKLEEGDLLIVDFGAVYNGYHTDETCTIKVGTVSEKAAEIYDIVLEAHDRAIEYVSPGLRASDVDRVARDYIRQKGYGDFFGHGTGHGVGLEIHELPVISEKSEDILEEGMVFTIEPGIYLPEVGGVRIEDMIHVTAEGAEIITRCNEHMRG
ncbi:MAG: aminopeptidase P family protein [Proteobacteria bacterium]|nr:aminopeptidase P family protein [Pseudomonadota bacterium]